jgi:hypothetical protein
MFNNAKYAKYEIQCMPSGLVGLLALVLSANAALANQVVYKCGQEVTNQPADPNLCQALNISQPTQIEGTRVQPASEIKPSQAATTQLNSSSDAPDRKTQARTILEDEWRKLTNQYTELVHIYNQGQPTPLTGESIHQPSYQQRTLTLKAQLQRVERDLQALQRELGRYGVRMSGLPLK